MINDIWTRYSGHMRAKYERYLEIYGMLSNLFNQKKDKNKDNIPQLDPKFQETIYQTCFTDKNKGIISKEEDFDNTPHDILSIFPNGVRVGIGLKTWRNSNQSYQKVAQMKKHHNHIMSLVDRYKNTGNKYKRECLKLRLVLSIARIKNTRLTKDYKRLEISPFHNIYSYITRDYEHMKIQETSYPKIHSRNITVNNIKIKGTRNDPKRILFFDGQKHYKFTFSDSQCYMQFNHSKKDHITVDNLQVKILKNPLEFLNNAYNHFILPTMKQEKSIFVPNTVSRPVYLPMYSKEGNKKFVPPKSGLNDSFAGDGYKDKAHTIPRPNYEVYIPVPTRFRKLNKYWFNPNIDISNRRQYQHKHGKGYYPFRLHLPNGKVYNARLTQSNFKALMTDPQNAIGKWIIKSLFNKKPSERVSMSDLYRWDWGSVILWHKIPGNYNNVWIDVKPVNAYEHFIANELRHK